MWRFIKPISLISAWLFYVCPASAQLKTFKINSVKELKDFFKYTPDRTPLICGHRGGASVQYPENALETFEYCLSKTNAFFELDPRLTKDSVVVIMHDATLDRTTNGSGKLSDYNWEQVKKLRLKDKKGNLTSFHIQKLDDIMEWAKGKTVLMLDKKDVPLSMLLKIIEKHNAESFVLISSYEVAEAKFYYQQNKHLMFEAFIKDTLAIKAYEKAGIPWQNIVAYLGQWGDKDLFQSLHKKGVMCITYTAKTLEKNKDKVARIEGFKKLIDEGTDIILADRPLEAANAIQSLYPQKSSKYKYYVNK